MGRQDEILTASAVFYLNGLSTVPQFQSAAVIQFYSFQLQCLLTKYYLFLLIGLIDSTNYL